MTGHVDHPYSLEVKAGEKYFACQCGASKTPPNCDGAHKTTGSGKPSVFTAEKDETVYICGCGQSATKPFCDGAHTKK